MHAKLRIKGMVRICVIGPDGKIKRHEPSWIRRVFGMPGKLMLSKHHNTVTRQGEGLIANLLTANPTKSKITYATGYIQLGTGWTGNSVKTNTRCNTATGDMQSIDTDYPVTKEIFGTTGDNILKFRASFEAGKLNASNINEACLLNGNTAAAISLAYAQITTAATVTLIDTLQVIWEITFTGS